MSWRTAALAFAALLPLQAAAQETGFSEQGDAELIAIVSSSNRWLEQPCEVGVPALRELRSRDPEDEDFISRELYALALCADQRADYSEGARLAAELERLNPEGLFYTFGLYFEIRSEDADALLVRFRSMEAETAAQLDDSSLWAAFRILIQQDKAADAEQFALNWHDEGGLDLFGEDSRGSLAIQAIRAALRADRLDEVARLLAYVQSPSAYVSLLADRHYSAAWPQIEERAGENLERIGQEYVESALARLEANGTDRDRFSAAAHALYFAGRFQNAVALAQQWRGEAGAGGEIAEGDAWALNIQAFAYDALGEPEKADAVFDELARLSPEENAWVVNFVINRASRLVGQGRWEEGLEAAALARDVADQHGSPYAKLLIARDHACALIELDRAGETAGELTFLRENSDVAAYIAAQGLMCAGNREEAASLMIASLENESRRGQVMENLQPSAFELFYTPSILPQVNELLAESPQLTETFNRYGRIIPEKFTPIASTRRKHWREPR